MMRDIDFDARGADSLEERLELVRNVQRKYGGSYAAVREFYERASAEAEMLDNASERTEELAKEIARTGERLSREAEELGALRAAAAESFERDMTKELADLGMSGTTFKVKIDSDYSPDAVGETGGDRVEFLISPNVGEPLKPLAKIISGGEMSRFMLALKNIVAGIDRIGTMVFDEIDTGISGHIQRWSRRRCATFPAQDRSSPSRTCPRLPPWRTVTSSSRSPWRRARRSRISPCFPTTQTRSRASSEPATIPPMPSRTPARCKRWAGGVQSLSESEKLTARAKNFPIPCRMPDRNNTNRGSAPPISA